MRKQKMFYWEHQVIAILDDGYLRKPPQSDLTKEMAYKLLNELVPTAVKEHPKEIEKIINTILEEQKPFR